MPTAQRAKPESYAVPALDKGLDVLELLSHAPDGLTKSQIARELSRTVSEIFRMLLCLERRGYIAQSAPERYTLTLKLFRLVQEHPPTERLIATALPLMHQLAHDTLQSCHLGVLEGSRITIVAQTNAPSPIGFYVKLGSTVDLMDSSSGYVLLAHQEEEQRRRIVDTWARETGHTPPADLDQHLARIRRAGHERRNSYLVRGVTNISFPILDERGGAVAALTIPHIQNLANPIPDATILASLARAASDLTLAIGGIPSHPHSGHPHHA